MRRLAASLALTLLVGCGAPADIGLLSEQDVAAPDAGLSIAASPAPRTGGFLAGLFGTPSPQTATQPDTSTAAAAAQEAGSNPDTDTGPDTDTDPEARALAAAPKPQTRGFFAALLGGADKTPAPRSKALVTPAAMPVPGQDAAPKGDITFGTRLPYGTVASVCGVKPRQLGKRVAMHPERGGQYRLYDSDPGSSEPRSMYIMGFQDGCARQFTAALAMFGSVELHEQLRYGLPAEVQPYSDTDRAYERLKRKVCNKPRRKPCGAKIRLLERDTVFVSIYQRFGVNSEWSNLLLHRGAVLAQDHKSFEG